MPPSITPTPASFRRRGCARAGFTLMELIIVISIMVVAAAMIMPRWGAAVARQRVDAAARRIAADLTLAQAQSRAASKSVKVTFEPTTSTYEVVGLKDPDTGKDTYVVDLTAPPYAVQLRSASFDARTSVQFNAFGIPNAGGEVCVGSSDFYRTVTLIPDSGEVQIGDAAAEPPVKDGMPAEII